MAMVYTCLGIGLHVSHNYIAMGGIIHTCIYGHLYNNSIYALNLSIIKCIVNIQFLHLVMHLL